MRLLFELKPRDLALDNLRILKRRAARAIVLDGENILLLYTKRYNDFSFPGGGVNDNEDLLAGLHRELNEETGAQDIKITISFGYVDEIRPHYKTEYEFIHMLSYFFVCEIGRVFTKTQYESYEIDNGMEAKWINIHKAIQHNEAVMNMKEATMGLSIQRETLALRMVAQELVTLKIS